MFNVREFYDDIVGMYEKQRPEFWQKIEDDIAKELELEYYFYGLPESVPKIVREFFENQREFFEMDFKAAVDRCIMQFSDLVLGHMVDGFYEYMQDERLEEKSLEPKQLLWDMAK